MPALLRSPNDASYRKYEHLPAVSWARLWGYDQLAST